MNTIINADLNKRVVSNTEKLAWSRTDLSGVDRRMLERSGNDGSKRATSIVRYEAGSSYSLHCHPYGEEIFVIDGVFSDEKGDFPTGSYIRNPPGSYHQSYSKYGCIIFVKLQQISLAEITPIQIDTHQEKWQQSIYAGIDVINLYSDKHETVKLIRFQPNTIMPLSDSQNGEETLVLEGYFQDEQQLYPKRTWIRNPTHNKYPFHSQYGCTIYRKTGHFPH